MPLTGEHEPSTAEWVRKQVETFETSSGQEANQLRGRPIIVLTSVGAKTGKLRKTALMRVEHDGRYAVVASKGGAPNNPVWEVWYWNLLANPHVEVQDSAVKNAYIARLDIARLVAGTEYDEWWARANETWPAYATYQAKTKRKIPLFVLEAMVN